MSKGSVARAAVRSLRGMPTRLVGSEQVRVVRAVVTDHVSTARWVVKHGEAGLGFGRGERMNVWRARRQAVLAAKQYAAELRAGGAPGSANKASAAVDRRTGQVYVGHNRERLAMPEQVRARLPSTSRTRWRVDNCGEVAAATRAVQGGASMDDLVIRTVTRRKGRLYLPCDNCSTWARP